MTIRLEVNAEDAGKRLDWFLHERLPEYSRSRLQSWIKAERVRLGGSPARPSQALRQGDQIEVTPGELPPLKAQAEDLPLAILYEDADVVAVDKPAGMVVHAGAGHHEGTLVNALLHRFGTLSSVGGELRPGVVHRLDKDTSGVLIVARNDRAHRALAEQFQRRSVEKIYVALVHGKPPKQGTVDKPIARDPSRRTKMTARLATGRRAVTHYDVVEQIGPLALLRVRIETGRTHQIRVHLASIGYPIVGDTLYGGRREIEGLRPLGRFFLHAARLRFRSPSTGAEVEVGSQLPADLADWLERARAAMTPRTHNRERR